MTMHSPAFQNFGRSGFSRQDAFTLLEVMIAVMVFGIAVVGLLMALSSTIGTAAAFDRESKVALSLQNQLAEAREIDFAAGTATVGPDEMGVVYTKDISPLELQNKDGQQLNGLYSIRITATWGQGGPDETETGEVYVYKP